MDAFLSNIEKQQPSGDSIRFLDELEQKAKEVSASPTQATSMGQDISELKKPKRSFFENILFGLAQLQRGQSALINPSVEAKGKGIIDSIANSPGAVWRGLTAPTEKLTDFTTLARAYGLNPYKLTTDTMTRLEHGEKVGPLEILASSYGPQLASAEVLANLVLDPANLIGVGTAGKVSKAASLLIPKLPEAYKALSSFAKIPVVEGEKVVNAADNAVKSLIKSPVGRLFNTSSNPKLKLLLSELRTGISQAGSEARGSAAALRENIKKAAMDAGIPIEDFTKQLMDKVEDLPGNKVQNIPLDVVADEFKTAKKELFENRKVAGLEPSELGGGLKTQINDLTGEMLGSIRETRAPILSQTGKNLQALNYKLGNIENELYNETLKHGATASKSMEKPIASIDRQIATREARIKDLLKEGDISLQLTGMGGEKGVNVKDYRRTTNIFRDIKNVEDDIIKLKNHKSQLEGVQALVNEPALSEKLTQLKNERGKIYQQYFDEIGEMNKKLDKIEPAVRQKIEPAILKAQENLAANPNYAVHALTPEADDYIKSLKDQSVFVSGEKVSLENPSDIARTFLLNEQNEAALRALGFTDLQGVGKTINKIDIPGRSLTRKEVNALAENGILPGYEGIVFSQNKPTIPYTKWVKNEFFYSDPVIGRAIETMRTNRQLAFKRFMDDVEANFKDPNGVDFHGVKIAPEIAEDLNRFAITIHQPNTDKIFQNKVLNIFDKSLTGWKFLATSINPGFHIRNALSGVWSNTFFGVTDPELYGPVEKSIETTAKMISKATGQILEPQALKAEAIRRGIIKDAGFFGQDLPALGLSAKEPSALQKGVEGAYEAGSFLGRTVESKNRAALWLDRLRKGDSFDQATAIVHKAHFDYGDLTPFEQNVMKRAIPFYSWLKNNIPLQVELMIKQPGRYNTLTGKLLREIEKSGGEVPQEEKEVRPEYFGQFGFTRTGLKGSKGSPIYFNPNLPFQDIRQLAPSEALQNVTSAANPLASTMLQLLYNRDFRNRELAKGADDIPDIPYFLQGEYTPARGAGNLLGLIPGAFGRAPVYGAPDEKALMVPPRVQYLLNRVPALANLGELFSGIGQPNEEKIPFLGDIDTGVLSGFGGVKLTPLDLQMAGAYKMLQAKKEQEAKKRRMRREGTK